MSGGGGGLISLDDLESVSEEQLSYSAEDEHEEMVEEQDRLLNYWTDVARGHQVDVPTGKSTTTTIMTVTRMRVDTRGNNRDPLYTKHTAQDIDKAQ